MRSFVLGVMLLSAAVAGCGRRSPGATASGTISFNGQPAPAGIRVDFIPTGEGGSMSTGYTDEAGRYDLFFNANLRGVMPGECVVRLSLGEATGADGLPTTPEALRGVQIPAAFGERSTTVRVVRPGPNTFDLEVGTQ